MSYITDVVVVTSTRHYDDQLTAPMSFDAERQQSLKRIDTEAAGGFKVFTSYVYAAACNYLPVEEFKGWISELLADDPSAVVWLDTEGQIEVFCPAGIVRGYVPPERGWWGS